MIASNEFQRALAEEAAAEAARVQFADREMLRCRGVAWSGMEPSALPRATPEALATRARSRLTAREAWRQSHEGVFLAAIADCQAAAREAYALAERGRAGAARGEPAAWRADLLRDLRRQAIALTASLRRARSILTP